MFCVLCRRLFWRDPKPEGRLKSRSRTRAVRRAAVEARSSVRAMEGAWNGGISIDNRALKRSIRTEDSSTKVSDRAT